MNVIGHWETSDRRKTNRRMPSRAMRHNPKQTRPYARTKLHLLNRHSRDNNNRARHDNKSTPQYCGNLVQGIAVLVARGDGEKETFSCSDVSSDPSLHHAKVGD